MRISTKMKSVALAGLSAALLATTAQAETVRWGAPRDIVSLDPYSYGDSYTINFLNHIYEGLVRYNRDLEIEPALATEWEIVSPTTWRFTLRKDVKFHDGADFTAEDVLASLERVSDETSPLKGNLPAYKSATVVDDYTIDIELNGAYPLLLNDLTNIHIFDKGWLVANNAEKPTDVSAGVEGFATFNTNGTGPFVLESRTPEAQTILTVNENWWDEPAHNLTRIEFQPISSAATRVAALLSGEVDFVDSAPVQDLGRLEQAENLTLLERTDLRTVMLGFNRRDELVAGGENPMNDLRVRQAMQMAVDMDLIQDKVMRGKSRNAGTLVAPSIPGYSEELDTPAAYDPEKAKELLAEAGYPDGFEFDFVCTNESYVNEEQFCQAIASMWSRVGLTPKLDIGPTAKQTPKRANGKADVYTIGWATLPMLDTYSILVQMLHSKEGNSGVFNWGDWSYPELDKLTQSAAVELDRDTRLQMETDALKIAKDEIIMMPLHQQPMAWAVSKGFSDFPQFPDNKPRMWYVTK
ncbi:ABC transporter substrate-binding protein [Litoreibacter arenae]|uniref:Putative peptide-binding periplasmic ABC transporter protein n=1 Tax=Litoreibacter arenae DSM 19593 TaxID=1123360 RepID=S9QD90_9RHOB|nr:ABC transporter substrate-binding protein [Litoreibacter arenae]EPX79401.1 putative peptide-binding periplasmic ABC transporter protein [Litoreibacter arenae DSM 19593]